MYLFVLCLIFWEVINISDLLSKYRGRNNCVTNQKSYIFYCLFLVYVLYLNFENEKYSLHRKELVHVLYFNGYVNSISFTFFFYKNDKYTWLLPPLMLTHSRLSSLTCPHVHILFHTYFQLNQIQIVLSQNVWDLGCLGIVLLCY